MNFIPKEIKESLDIFKKTLTKLCYTTLNAPNFNYSKIFEHKNYISIEDKKIYNFIGTCECIMHSKIQVQMDFIFFIKELNLKFNINDGIFDVILHDKENNFKQCILKGIINNYNYVIYNYSYPIKIKIPNVLNIDIIIISNKENLQKTDSSILNKGIINFGLILI